VVVGAYTEASRLGSVLSVEPGAQECMGASNSAGVFGTFQGVTVLNGFPGTV
jgi:hypothetical protein